MKRSENIINKESEGRVMAVKRLGVGFVGAGFYCKFSYSSHGYLFRHADILGILQ